MIKRVKELRKHLPIPIGEALQMLQDNEGDIEKCIYLFKAKSIKLICEQTGCDLEMAAKYYEEEKFDINKAISSVNEALFDFNYKPITGLTREKLQQILQWIRIVQEKDFAYSLSFNQLSAVIDNMFLIPELKDTANILERAYESYNSIFEGYSDDSPMEDFVRRNQKLDYDIDFMNANNLIPLRITIIKDCVLRHGRQEVY